MSRIDLVRINFASSRELFEALEIPRDLSLDIVEFRESNGRNYSQKSLDTFVGTHLPPDVWTLIDYEQNPALDSPEDDSEEYDSWGDASYSSAASFYTGREARDTRRTDPPRRTYRDSRVNTLQRDYFSNRCPNFVDDYPKVTDYSRREYSPDSKPTGSNTYQSRVGRPSYPRMDSRRKDNNKHVSYRPDERKQDCFEEGERQVSRQYDDGRYDDNRQIGRRAGRRHSPDYPRFTNRSSYGKVPVIPKTLVFDGKTKWSSFKTKFLKYAQAHEWSEATRRENLCWFFEGIAADYYAMVLQTSPAISYSELMRKLEKRFGFKDLPETATITFNNAKQKPEETLEEWADRVLDLGTKAFKDLPEDYMFKQVVLRFCLGCHDREAGERVANQRPRDIQEAIDKVKWSTLVHIGVHGKTARRDVREVREAEPVLSVQKVKAEVKDEKDKERLTSIESDISALKADVKNLAISMTSKLDKFEKMISEHLKRTPRTRSQSPRPRESGCWRCQGDHFIRDCPLPPTEKETRVKKEAKGQEASSRKKVAFVSEQDEEDKEEDDDFDNVGVEDVALNY